MAKKRVMGRAPRGSKPNPKTIKNPPHMSRKPRFASQDEAMEYLHDRKIKVSVEIIKLEGLPDVQNNDVRNRVLDGSVGVSPWGETAI